MARTLMSLTELPKAGGNIALSAMDVANGNYVNVVNPRAGQITCVFNSTQPSCTITVLSGYRVDDDLTISSRVINLTQNQTYIFIIKNPLMYMKDGTMLEVSASAACSAAFYR
jgi:hypothetical protein